LKAGGIVLYFIWKPVSSWYHLETSVLLVSFGNQCPFGIIWKPVSSWYHLETSVLLVSFGNQCPLGALNTVC